MCFVSVSADVLSVPAYILRRNELSEFLRLSSLPSFYYKKEGEYICSTLLLHYFPRQSGWTGSWRTGADLGCRTRLGGWESWAAADGKKVAEQAAATTSPSVLRIDCFEKGERRRRLLGVGNHTSRQKGTSPSHSSVMHSCLRTVCQRAPQHGVNTSSLPKIAWIHGHTLLLLS